MDVNQYDIYNESNDENLSEIIVSNLPSLSDKKEENEKQNN